MNWDNYGSYWHIDHIIPCSYFNLSYEDQLRGCFNYKNTRPLKKEDNYKKSDTLPDDVLKKGVCYF